eukprot:2244100-Pyramimonas_sp.AAC.1
MAQYKLRQVFYRALNQIKITNLYEEYGAQAWQDYCGRGWCRLEMFFGANIPLSLELDHNTRGPAFRAALGHFVSELNRRPHLIFGTK